MKILHVIPYMHPSGGGPPVVASRFCLALQELGEQVRLVSTDALSPDQNLDWVAELQPTYSLEILPAFRRKAFGYSQCMTQRLGKLVPESDIVHLHNLWSYQTLAVARVCRQASVPFVVSTHGMLDPNSLRLKSLKKKAYGQLIEFPRLRQASGMIYTHQEEQILAEKSVRDLPQGHVVSLGVDDPPHDLTDSIRELHSEFPSWQGKRLLLFLGRLHPKKGLDLLIPAFDELHKTFNDLHLVLAGPGETGYIEGIKREIAARGLDSCVTLTGPRYGDQKWALYSMAEVFVLPSYQENFAICAAEALKSKTPVVMSRRVNIWSDLAAANAALICDLTVQSVVAEVASALSNSDLCSQLKQNGLQIASEQYVWKRSAMTLLKVYRNIVSG